MSEQNVNSDLTMIFENFIKPGVVVEEKEVVPGFKVKLKPLNTEELLIAESIMHNEKAPADIVARVRGASILSRAIISLNGASIERDDFSEEDTRLRRALLYKQLLQLPAIVIHKTYKFYIECVNKQQDLYMNPQEVIEKVENF